MRIALVGAHGTGKTTLSVALAGELGIPMLPEPVRPVLRRRGLESADYRHLPPLGIGAIQTEILCRHLDTLGEAPDSFVADRTAADVLAYSLYWLGHVPEAQVLLTAFAQAAKAAAGWYDLVFLVPPHSGWVQADGTRITTPGHQLTIHALVRQALQDLGYTWTEVGPAELDDRITFCKRAIRAYTLARTAGKAYRAATAAAAGGFLR
jgi:predicted ATPase